MLSKLKNNFLLISIILFGLFIRLYKLDQYPVSLNWDEISHSYNAYSLLKTGQDQWGTAWPIFNFRAYGDYPTTLNMYLTLPLVKYFGLNAWTARLPSAIFGFLTIPLIYFLSLILLKNKKMALVITFLSALSPWSLFPSRAVFQSTVAQFFFIGGLGFLIHSLKQQKAKSFFLAMLFVSLSQYAYHNTRLVVPLLVPIVLLIFFTQFKKLFQKQKTTVFLSILLFFAFTIPQLLNLISPESRARGRWTFILNEDAINLINHSRGQSSLNPALTRLVYNKATYFIPKFIGNYLDFFNPKLLFFQGTGQHQFNIPHTGILFPVCLPFFYLGLIYLFKLPPKTKKLIISWYAIGLLPATITSGDFPIIRAVTILPLPYVLVALGFAQLQKLFHQKPTVTLIFFFLISLQFLFYWKNYFGNYAKNYSQSWQYGYKQAVTFVKQNYSKYDQIIFTKKYGEPHQFVLFYWPWEPSAYQNDPKKIWDYHASWYWVDTFDKFRFINDWEISHLSPLPSTLLISSPQNYPVGGQLLSTINFLDGSSAFDIISYED